MPQELHRDGGNGINHVVMANVLIALVDFDESNGPTRYIRGSHKHPFVAQQQQGPDGPPPQTESLFTAPAGSALVYDNRLVHGRGPNISTVPRYTMSLFCCRSWVKPFVVSVQSLATRPAWHGVIYSVVVLAVCDNCTCVAGPHPLDSS